MNIKRQSQSTAHIPTNDEVYGNYKTERTKKLQKPHSRRLSTIVHTNSQQMHSQVNLKSQSI